MYSTSYTSSPDLIDIVSPFVAAGCNYFNGEFLRLQSDLALKVHYIIFYIIASVVSSRVRPSPWFLPSWPFRTVLDVRRLRFSAVFAVVYCTCYVRMAIDELNRPTVTYRRDQLFSLYTPDRPIHSVVVSLQSACLYRVIVFAVFVACVTVGRTAGIAGSSFPFLRQPSSFRHCPRPQLNPVQSSPVQTAPFFWNLMACCAMDWSTS